MAENGGREAGLKARQEVLGPEYVRRAQENADEFTQEFQDYLNEHCWGTVWTRDGLERRTRSLVTISVLATSSRWNEFTTHVRGALRNGCTPDEIREVLLHLAIYAGVPTSVEAFRNAQPVIADWKQSAGG